VGAAVGRTLGFVGFAVIFTALIAAGVQPYLPESGEKFEVVIQEPMRIERAIVVGAPPPGVDIETIYDWIGDDFLGPVLPRPVARPEPPMLVAPEQ
jgi:hypothetical protein